MSGSDALPPSPQAGIPFVTVKTFPSVPIPNLAKTLAAEAYIISPVVVRVEFAIGAAHLTPRVCAESAVRT